MGCGKSKALPGMPDTLENWTMIFDFIHERVKAKPQYVSAIYLVILLEISEFLFKELKEPVKGYSLLEDTLVQFHRAKEEEDQREEEEKKKRRRQSGVKKIDREAGDTEEDEMIKKKQKSRTLKVVIRFLQRRLLMWNKELNAGKASGEQKLTIESTALKEKEKYAVVDGDGTKDDDDSDAEEDEKKGDPFCKGWVPGPKASLELDRLDIFLAGDYEFPSFAAGDPLGLFFKLRYGSRLADQKNHEKALEVLEKAYGLAADVAEEQKRENDAAMEEERKAKAKLPKQKPQKKKSLTGKELIPHDPRRDLYDVVEMCKRKVYLWRLEYHK